MRPGFLEEATAAFVRVLRVPELLSNGPLCVCDETLQLVESTPCLPFA
jgi:hypothetical protein